jgi:hypothetical protein
MFSALDRLSVTLLAAGAAGALFVLVYQRACEWADWDLMSSRVRRRVHACRRRAPAAFAGSGVVAGLGLVLLLVDGLA